MKFRLTIRTSLSILLGFAVLFSLTSVLRFLNIQTDEKITRAIPENSNFVTVVKGTEVLRKTIFTVLMEARDKELLAVINEEIKNKRNYKGPSKNIGLDFLNNFALFGVNELETQLLGFVIDIKNLERFNRNKANYFDSTTVFANTDQQLLVLRKMSGASFEKEERGKFQNYANQLLASKDGKADQFFNLRDAGMLHLYTNQGLFGKSSVFKEVKLNVNEVLQQIQVNGDFKLNPAFSDRSDNIYTLEKDGFHFRSQIIPQSLRDTINSTFEAYGLFLPPLVGISFNYRNTDIQNTNEGLRVSPEIDLLLTFKEDIDFKEAITNVGILMENGWEVKGEKLTNGIFDYKLRQINPKTVLISSKKKDIKIVLDPEVLFEISGSPAYTTQLTGNPFIVGFIQMFNIYKSSNTLFKSIENIDLRIKEFKDKELNLDGKIYFKPDHYPLNELLKFAITSEMIQLNN